MLFKVNYNLPYSLILVRNLLILFGLFSFTAGVVIFFTSLILINALRKVNVFFLNQLIYVLLFDRYVVIIQEHEKRIVSWLYTFAAFTIFRFIAWVFVSIVNDQIFFYNYTMMLLWGCFTITNVYGWILVYSLYLELSDLSKLEDLAHLRVSLKRIFLHKCLRLKVKSLI